MAAWNALFILSGLFLVALAGETYFRLTKPFINNSIPLHFVDGVGLIKKPNAEMRYGRWDDDFWVISHTNSQGFLDREPVSPERAADGCHIAFIGDSFVEAKEVPIADKFHVRLEEMAARELPHLGITTQAYGISVTGQINQLPFYDEYARRLNPKVVALVFVLNDFGNNSTALSSLARGWDPDRMPFMSAQRDARGNITLRPPDPEYERSLLPRPPQAWYASLWNRLTGVSYFAKWLDRKKKIVAWLRAQIGASFETDPYRAARGNALVARPCCASLLDDWQSMQWPFISDMFMEERLPPVYEEALEYTAFGVEQFKSRADRDGAQLTILSASDYMGTRGDPQFDRLNAIAEASGIPLISQYDYMVKQGYNVQDSRWRHDGHWNANGHQWAAEAFLEWLKENQDVCA